MDPDIPNVKDSSSQPLSTEDDQLSVFPEEVWIHILKQTSGTSDIKNVLLAYPWLDHAVQKKKANYFIGEVMPFLMTWLSTKEVYSCRGVSNRWCASVDKHIQSRCVKDIRQMSDIRHRYGLRPDSTPNFYTPAELDTPAKIAKFKSLLMSSQHPPAAVAKRNPFICRALVINPKVVVVVPDHPRVEEFRILSAAEYQRQFPNLENLGREIDSDDDDDEVEHVYPQQNSPVPLFWTPIRGIVQKHGHHIYKAEIHWNSLHRAYTTYHPTFYNAVEFCQIVQDHVLKYMPNLKTLVLRGYNMEMDGLNASNYLSSPSCNLLTHSLDSLENLDLSSLQVPHVLYNWILGKCTHVNELAIRFSNDPDWIDEDIIFPNLRHVLLSNIPESQVDCFGEILASKVLSRCPTLSSIRVQLVQPYYCYSDILTIDKDLLTWIAPYRNITELEICGDGVSLAETGDCDNVANSMPYVTSLKIYDFYVEFELYGGEDGEQCYAYKLGYKFLLNFPNLERLHLQCSSKLDDPPGSSLSSQLKVINPATVSIIDLGNIYNSKIWELITSLKRITTTEFMSAEENMQVFLRV